MKLPNAHLAIGEQPKITDCLLKALHPLVARGSQLADAVHLAAADAGKLEQVGSQMLRIELKNTADRERRRRVRALLPRRLRPIDSAVARRARELMSFGLKAADAVHVAAAEQQAADVLLTTDDRLIRAWRARWIEPRRVVSVARSPSSVYAARREEHVLKRICHRRASHVPLLMVAWLSVAALGQSPASAPASRPWETDPAEIDRLIAALSDPSYEKRTDATRRLCAIGPAAEGALRKAARGDEYETALRARNLLAVFDKLFFAGLDIRLSLSRDEIAWNEPVTLTLTFANRSKFPAHVPLVVATERREKLPPAVREVADLIDVADYLMVTGPDGEPVDLRVDDITANPAVAAVVHERSEGGPVETLTAGQELVYRIDGVNRAFARYPLLEAGTYTFTFAYEPDWDDPALRTARAGYVTAAPATLKVRTPAPEVVRKSRTLATLAVTRDGEALVAKLTNVSDLPLAVNTNLGSDDPPFSQLSWSVRAGEEPVKLRARLDEPLPALESFSRAKLLEVASAASIELGRLPLARLADEPLLAKLPTGSEFHVRVVYANRTDRAWQMAEGNLIGSAKSPEALREPLPPRLFNFQVYGDEITLTKPK